MIQSFAIGIFDAINPCAVFTLLFLLGFLLLTSIKNKVFKNSLYFIITFFIATIIFYTLFNSLMLIKFTSINFLTKILIFIFGLIGVGNFFFYKKEIFKKINKTLFSPVMTILFGILLPLILIPCSAGMGIMAIANQMGSLILYFLGFIIPFILISLLGYFISSEKEENNRIKYLKLIAGIILIAIVLLL